MKVIKKLFVVMLMTILSVTTVFAESKDYEIKSVSASNKTGEAKAMVVNYSDLSMKTKETFYNVGETVTYKITLKNNTEKNKVIESIKGDGDNKFISYSYKYDDKTFEAKGEFAFYMTVKYEKATDSLKSELNITVSYTDGTETKIIKSSNPVTKDKIGKYLIIFVTSGLIMIVFLKRNMKVKKALYVVPLVLMAGVMVSASTDKLEISLVDEVVIVKEDTASYNVVYMYNNLTYSEDVVAEGDAVTKIDGPSKDGYTFKYWSLQKDGDEYDFTTKVTSNVVLYPVFEANKYKVVFNSNGGTGSMEPQELTYDKKELLNANAYTRNNYNFVKWNTKKDGTGTSYDDEAEVKNLSTDEDITLYAIWKEIEYKSYSNYESVYFDPVEYEICDIDKSSSTCYEWIVLSKNGNKYELLYKYNADGTENSNMVWSVPNTSPVDLISSYTTNWSNNLTVSTDYDVEAMNGAVNYKFSETKARMLNENEITDSVKEALGYSCANDYGYTSCVSIDTTTQGFYLYNSLNGNTIQSMPFPAIIYGGLVVNGKINPVIYIDLEDGVGNAIKEDLSYTCIKDVRLNKGIHSSTLTTFGTVASTTLKAGDILSCDVDGDGKYNSYTEKFYYINTLNSNNDYAVLVAANNYVNKNDTLSINNSYGSSNGAIAYNSEQEKAYNGPATAINYLPTTTQWKNISLTNSTRQLVTETGATSIDSNNLESNFSYAGKAARLLTYQEGLSACGAGDITSTNYLNQCNYLLDNTGYISSADILGYWLENPKTVNDSWVIHGSNSLITGGTAYSNTSFGVRPAIEVKKSKIYLND